MSFKTSDRFLVSASNRPDHKTHWNCVFSNFISSLVSFVFFLLYFFLCYCYIVWCVKKTTTTTLARPSWILIMNLIYVLRKRLWRKKREKEPCTQKWWVGGGGGGGNSGHTALTMYVDIWRKHDTVRTKWKVFFSSSACCCPFSGKTTYIYFLKHFSRIWSVQKTNEKIEMRNCCAFSINVDRFTYLWIRRLGEIQ